MSAENSALRCQRISFRHLDHALAAAGWERVDGVLLDLGVSSLQIDDPSKGFTYREDGPLDLRFDQAQGPTAADLLAGCTEKELADWIWRYGEESASRRIARAVIRARKEATVTRTGHLREIVTQALPGGKNLMPALSRVFQALRIAVNDELQALSEILGKLPGLVAPEGRFVIISYHSLEDRLVKQFIDREKRDCLCSREIPVCVCGHKRTLVPLTAKAVKASAQEEKENPRARSARLRAARML